MATIIKTEVIELPRLKLIGKRYTDADRNAQGTFSDKWGEWFANGWFDKLHTPGGIQGLSDDYIGLIHCTGNGYDYYIGIFMAESDPVPDGFEAVTLNAGRAFVSYIYGHEATGELYGESINSRCFDMLRSAGFTPTQPGWQFERYNCPRFTSPDDTGRVILDYGIYID